MLCLLNQLEIQRYRVVNECQSYNIGAPIPVAVKVGEGRVTGDLAHFTPPKSPVTLPPPTCLYSDISSSFFHF